jgi:hypothetical protein
MIRTRLARGIPTLLVILLAPLGGCMRHVYFPEGVRPIAFAADSAPVRLLYDRFGNLYPDGSVTVGGEETIQPVRVPIIRAGNWSLQNHYRRRPDAWKQLAARYLRDTLPYHDDRWTPVQDSIRAEGLRAITARSRPGAPIVILVHGFNVSAPKADSTDAMDATRDSLKSWYGDRFPGMTFVEVRWDGLVAQGPGLVKKVGGLQIWPRAQANGYYVGMELRRILSALPHDRPVRILTHSLGAHVATAALWNVSSKLSGNVLDRNAGGSPRAVAEWVQYFDGFSHPAYRTPTHPDLRLAMIVPAMPGLTFGRGSNLDYYDRNYEGRPPVTPGYQVPRGGPPSTYDRIVIGQNQVDEVIQKYINKPPVYGSTTLGSQYSEFRDSVAPIVNGRPEMNGGRSVIAYRVDIREAPAGVDEKKHAWDLYLLRNNIRQLTDCLFTECDGPAVTTR